MQVYMQVHNHYFKEALFEVGSLGTRNQALQACSRITVIGPALKYFLLAGKL